MSEINLQKRACPDCNAEPGHNHDPGCDIELCAVTSSQMLTCDCGACTPLPWDGLWPGDAECIEFGWYCHYVQGKGWVPCDKDHPEARTDLNRLNVDACWDPVQRRWVRRS